MEKKRQKKHLDKYHMGVYIMEKDTVWGYEQESLQVECKPFLGTEPEQTGKQTKNIESTVRKKTDDKLRKEKGRSDGKGNCSE